MKMITEVDLNPELALQALLEMDLMAFTEFAFSVVRPGVLLKRNWHLDAVTHKLAQVAKGNIRRLIITLPPRSLKSLCASVALPAWFLGHYPWERVVVVSYSDFLSRTTRTISAAWSIIPCIKLPSPPCGSIVIRIARSRQPSAANALQPQSMARSPGSGEI